MIKIFKKLFFRSKIEELESENCYLKDQSKLHEAQYKDLQAKYQNLRDELCRKDLFNEDLYKACIDNLKSENRNLGAECEILRKMLGVERVCNEYYCSKCENAMIFTSSNSVPVQFCSLDCKCKDFEHI